MLSQLRKNNSGCPRKNRGAFNMNAVNNLLGRLFRVTRLIPQVAEERVQSSLGMLMVSSVAINLLALTMPIVMLIVMDRILPFRAIDTLVLLMVAATLAIMIETLLRTMRTQLTSWAAATFEHSLSVEVTSRLLVQPLDKFHAAGGGKHLEQFRKVSQLRQYFSGQSFTGWIDLPFSVLYLLVIAFISWPMALLLASGYFIFAIYAHRTALILLQPARERAEADQRRTNFLIETLTNIHTLKSMAMEALMLRRHDRLQEGTARAIERQAKVIDSSSSLSSLFSSLLGALVTALGAWEVIQGDMSRGELAACIFIVMRSLAPLQKIGLLWAKHHDDVTIGLEISETIQLPALRDGREELPLDLSAPAIQVTNVSFGYDNSAAPIIDRVSFSVANGGSLLIDGENGSGRSTMLALLGGFVTPAEGEIRLFGTDIAEFDHTQLNRLIGYIPQRATMFDGTLLQNATLFRSELNDRAIEVATDLGFASFIMALPQGWETRVGDTAAESLPPGLRQRIGMIRALAIDPPIVLFDDATASVDSEGEAAIMAYLTRAKGQKTLVLASHRPSLMRLGDEKLKLRSDDTATHSNSSPKTEILSKTTEEGFAELAVGRAGTYGDAFWARLDEAVAGAFRQPNDLSRIVAPLLREIGWRGEIRDVIEALPYYAEELDITGLSSGIARLGFKVIDRQINPASIDLRGYPCLVLPDGEDAMLLLGVDVDGSTISRSISNREQVTRLPEHGRAMFFEAEDDVSAPAAGWTWSAVKRFRPVLVPAVAVSVLAGALMLALALFTTLVFNQILPTGASDLLAYALGGVLFALGLVAVLHRLRASLLAYIAGRVEYVFGTAALSKIMQMSPSYTERSSVGAQITRLSSFQTIRDLFTSPVAAVLLELPATVVIAVVLCIINPVALPVLLVTLAVFALLYVSLSSGIRKRIAAQGRLANRRNEFLVEMIGKMRSIREGRGETIWLQRFRKISADTTFATFQSEKLTTILSSWAYMVMMLAGLAIVAFSIPGTLDGSIGPGALIASLILVWRVLGPIQALFNNLSRIGIIRVAAQQFDLLMQIKGERLPNEMRANIGSAEGQIEFSRVSFRYSMNADPALVGIGLDIPARQMIALTGANGSGKSTVLKLLLGMYSPQAGTIRIDGVDIRQMDPVELRRMVGYVPQEMQLFRATIAQNLRFAQPDATDRELERALEIAGALAQVKELPGGLNYRVGDGASDRLPASVRQKIVIARAYLTRAPILLFDEPSTGLDFEGDASFISALRALKGHRTVIFISHRPSHLKLADRVAVFQASYLQGIVEPAVLFPPTTESNPSTGLAR